MLHVDPAQRIRLEQVLQHDWIVHRDRLPRLHLSLQDAQLVKVTLMFICFTIRLNLS